MLEVVDAGAQSSDQPLQPHGSSLANGPLATAVMAVPSPPVSTRKLIVAALVCGLAILIAAAVQLVLLSR